MGPGDFTDLEDEFKAWKKTTRSYTTTGFTVTSAPWDLEAAEPPEPEPEPVEEKDLKRGIEL